MSAVSAAAVQCVVWHSLRPAGATAAAAAFPDSHGGNPGLWWGGNGPGLPGGRRRFATGAGGRALFEPSLGHLAYFYLVRLWPFEPALSGDGPCQAPGRPSAGGVWAKQHSNQGPVGYRQPAAGPPNRAQGAGAGKAAAGTTAIAAGAGLPCAAAPGQRHGDF